MFCQHNINSWIKLILYKTNKLSFLSLTHQVPSFFWTISPDAMFSFTMTSGLAILELFPSKTYQNRRNQKCWILIFVVIRFSFYRFYVLMTLNWCSLYANCFLSQDWTSVFEWCDVYTFKSPIVCSLYNSLFEQWNIFDWFDWLISDSFISFIYRISLLNHFIKKWIWI